MWAWCPAVKGRLFAAGTLDHMDDWHTPRLVAVPAHQDELGSLGVIERDSPFPFPIKRVYFLYDIPSESVRGSHAHKELRQLIVALSGSLTVELDDGKTKQRFDLTSPRVALTVPPGYWRTLSHFSAGSTALVLASLEYDERDYIRDYEEFVAWTRA